MVPTTVLEAEQRATAVRPLERLLKRESDEPVSSFVIFIAALLLFAPALFLFQARVIDLSAMRVLRGDVPYRDFWTMYAPGSIYFMALAFRVFGEQLIVSNTFGVLAAATAVVLYYRLAHRLLTGGWALLATLVFAFAFNYAGYHAGFTSYSGAIVCILLAAGRVTQHARTGAWRDVIVAGVWLGLAVFFKHDLGGYACIAAAVAVLSTGTRRINSFLVLASVGAGIAFVPYAALVSAGAGPGMVRDLLTWPLGDFRIVRPEYFPLLPSLWSGSIFDTISRNAVWAALQLPLIALVIAVPLLWRRRRELPSEQKRLLVFACVWLPLVWIAAHVRIDTHAITLPALGMLVGLAGLTGTRGAASQLGRAGRGVVVAIAVCWMLSFLPERITQYHDAWFPSPQRIDLPRLAGIITSGEQASQMRGLSRAIANAGPLDAPMLMLAERNDIVIYAQGVPYWLSGRAFVTRHHELYPDITDTDSYQREMLAAITAGPMPVIVRERRFDDATLERSKAEFQRQGLAVGSTLLDEWVARHYARGLKFGMYEVMRLR